MKKVIGIVGMPGAGKSIAREVVRGRGIPIVSMGDVVRGEAEARGIEKNWESLGRLMLKMREEGGHAIIAKKCLPKIKRMREGVVFIDGVRSLEEVEEFRRSYRNFYLIAIHASPRVRFRRLLDRGRADDPKDLKSFEDRDRRELRVGIGSVIAMADFMVVNEGSVEEARDRFKEVLEVLLKDD